MKWKEANKFILSRREETEGTKNKSIKIASNLVEFDTSRTETLNYLYTVPVSAVSKWMISLSGG